MDIQIEAISLNGVTGFDQDRFSAALSGELGRLAAAHASIGGTWRVVQVDLELPVQADSAAIGVQVARVIFDQVSRGDGSW